MEAVHGQAEVIIAKQRHGPTGTVGLHFDGPLTKFGDLERRDYGDIPPPDPPPAPAAPAMRDPRRA